MTLSTSKTSINKVVKIKAGGVTIPLATCGRLLVMPLTEQNLQLLPTTAALTQLLRGNKSTQKIVEAANKLAQKKHFFHWCLEFPEVFEAGGFDCVLGNPPWERIKLQEREFFASRSADIANAANKAAREKLIKELAKKNPQLAQAFEEAKHDADAQSKFIRESARFSLTAIGNINTYAVFAETTRKLISPYGRAGVILPTGIATDATTSKFFCDLIESSSLVGITGFKNERFIFTGIEHVVTFCIVVIRGSEYNLDEMTFSWLALTLLEANDYKRQFTLAKSDFLLLNPNTLNCPVFRTCTDADLTKKIYQRVPVIENERTDSNPWGISFMAMFHMANDSRLFKNSSGDSLVPLYEAKMFHQFDSRYSTYEGATQAQLNVGILPRPPEEMKQHPNYAIQPRYWVERTEVEKRLGEKWKKDWVLVGRKICRSTDERTFIASIIPKSGCGDSINSLIPSAINNSYLLACLCSNLNSLVFNFITRQKLGGTNLAFFIIKQLPVIPPEAYTQEDIEFISSRVLELVYTA